jgi:hypothetical protein
MNQWQPYCPNISNFTMFVEKGTIDLIIIETNEKKTLKHEWTFVTLVSLIHVFVYFCQSLPKVLFFCGSKR